MTPQHTLNVKHSVTYHGNPAGETGLQSNVYLVLLPHRLLNPLISHFYTIERIWISCRLQMASKMDFFPLLSSFLVWAMHDSSKNWSKVNLLHGVHVLHLNLYRYLHVRADILPRSQKAEDIQQKIHLFCFILLYCVTTELKGGICDLISPGNIKEKKCFIHRRKAPEFTQIKFTRLCLRDQAGGLTRIEVIGFLRGIKIKSNLKEKGCEMMMFEGH